MKIKELFEEKEVTLLGKNVYKFYSGLPIVFRSEMSDQLVWTESFICQREELTTLKGCPPKILGSFNASDNNLTTLIGGPKSVGIEYVCNANKLKTLEGCPDTVPGNFNAMENELESLKGSPSKIGGNCILSHNNLTSLEGITPEIGIMRGDLYCDSNKLKDLKNINKHIKSVAGKMIFFDNPIKSHVLGILLVKNCTSVELDNIGVEKIINKYLPNTRGREAIFDCQEELINAGFEEYAQL